MAKKDGPGDEWETPPALFHRLDDLSRQLFARSIQLDVCASSENHKCRHYWSKADNALHRRPHEWVEHEPFWMNPPYSNPGPWLEMARKAQHAGGRGFALIPLAAETRYFREHVTGVVDSILLLSKRIRFVGATASAKGPNVIVIYRPHLGDTRWIPFDITVEEAGKV